jgi:hypothetical protein
MDDPRVHPLLAEQARRNQATRDHWVRFAPHRQRVTELLIDAIPADSSTPHLAVLGAGNCNDLDLVELRQRFATIDLVDGDCQSVLQGIERQGLASDPSVRAVGPIDLSGMAEATSGWKADPPVPDAAIDVAMAATIDLCALPFQQVDVIASVCLLSQILDRLAAAIGQQHPRFLALVQHVRSSHYRLLIQHVRPGGTGLFITDVVSSDSAPQIIAASDLALRTLVRDCLEQGNFFTGLNPAVINSLLSSDPLIGPQVEEVRMIPPWLWDLGPRVYAVYAARFRRRLFG